MACRLVYFSDDQPAVVALKVQIFALAPKFLEHFVYCLTGLTHRVSDGTQPNIRSRESVFIPLINRSPAVSLNLVLYSESKMLFYR